MGGVWLLLCFLLAKCSLHEAIWACSRNSLSSRCYRPVTIVTPEERRQVINVMKKEAFRQLVEGDRLVRVTKVLFVKPDGSFFRTDFLIAPTECATGKKIPLEHLYSVECPLRKGALWRKCNGFFSIRNAFTVPIMCQSYVAAQTQDQDLLETTKVNKTEATVQQRPTFVKISSDPAKLEKFVKERVFQSAFGIGGRYARLTKVHSHSESEDGLKVNFMLAPSKCPLTAKVSFDILYSDACPMLPSEKQLSCSATFTHKPEQPVAINCNQHGTVEQTVSSLNFGQVKNVPTQENVPTTAGNENVPTRQDVLPIAENKNISTHENTSTVAENATTKDIIDLIKLKVFESKLHFQGRRARLVKLISKNDTGGDIEVEFALAPCECSSRQQISLEKLYSAFCPLIDVPQWLLCSGTLPRYADSKYLITCGGRMNVTKIEDSDRALLVSDMVEPSQVEKAVESIKNFMYSVRIQINGFYARAVKIYRYHPYHRGTYVEFSIAQSACKASEKISIPSLYSRRCPVLPADHWILCSGMLPFSSLDKHTVTCFERIEPDPALPEDEPEPTRSSSEERGDEPGERPPAEATQLESTIKEFIFSSGIRVDDSFIRLTSVLSSKENADGTNVQFYAAPTNCTRSSKVTLDQLYSDSCPIVEPESAILCRGTISRTSNEHEVTCQRKRNSEKKGQPETTTPSTSTSTSGTTSAEQSDPIIIDGKINLTAAIIKIKHMVHEADVQFGGWHARFMKLNEAKVVNGSVFAEFAIAPCECSAELKIPFDKLYSTLCPVFDVPEWMVCSGTLPKERKSKYLVTCGALMKAEKIVDAEVREVLEESNASRSAQMEKALQTVRRFIFNVKIEFAGSHARVVKLYKIQNYNDEIYAEFAIAQSGCKATQKVTLEILYSRNCPVLPNDYWLLCYGLLSHTTDSGYSMTCQGRAEAEPLPPDEDLPTPVINPEEESASKTNESRAGELEDLATLLKTFLLKSRIELNGTYPRFMKLNNYETNVSVEFTIAPTNCSHKEEVTLDQLYSNECSIDYTSPWLLCTGINDVTSHGSYSISCGERLEPEIEESPEPTPAPIPPQREVSFWDGVTSEELAALIRRSMFESGAQFGGWHARFAKLIKSEITGDDIDVEFAVAPSGCSSELKLSLETLYSSSCPLLNVPEWLICSGTLPNDSESTYLITCGGLMKVEQSSTSGSDTILEDHSSRTETSGFEHLTEEQKAIEAIKRFVFNVRIEVNGSYARMMKLYRFETAEAGILVEFSIAQSSCPITKRVHITTLYSEHCPILPTDYWILCNGIVPSSLYGNHSVSCLERIETDPASLQDSNMLPTGLGISRHDYYNASESSPIDSADVSLAVKTFLYMSRIRMNGSYVRLAKLIRHVDMPEESYVEFSISPTNCSRNVKISLEALYSDKCPLMETSSWVDCRGTVRVYHRGYSSVVCGTRRPDTQSIASTSPASASQTASPSSATTEDSLKDVEQSISLIKKYIFESKAEIGGWHAKFVKLLHLEKVDEDIVVSFALAPCGCRRDLKVTLTQLYSVACPLLNVTQWLVCNGSMPRSPDAPYLFKCNGRMSAEKDLNENRGTLENINSTSRSATDARIMDSIEAVKLFIFNVRLEVNGSYARLTKLYRFEPTASGVFVEFAISQSTCKANETIEIERLYSDSCPLLPTDYWLLCSGIVPRLPYQKHFITCNERIEVDPELHKQSRALDIAAASPSFTERAVEYAILNITEVTTALRKFIYEAPIEVEGAYGKLAQLHSYEATTAGVSVRFSVMKSNCTRQEQISMEELYSEHCPIMESNYSVLCEGTHPIHENGPYNIKCEKRMQVEDRDQVIAGPRRRNTRAIAPETSVALDQNNSTAIVELLKQLMHTQKTNIHGWYPRFLELLESYLKDGHLYVKYTVAPTTCPIEREIPIESIYSDSCAVRSTGARIVCDGVIPLRDGDFLNCRAEEEKTHNDDAQFSTLPTAHDGSDSSRTAEYLRQLLYTQRLNVDGWYPRLMGLLHHYSVDDGIHAQFTIVPTECRITANLALQTIYSPSCNEKKDQVITCDALIPLGQKGTINCHTGGQTTVYVPPSVEVTPHFNDQTDSTEISISIKNVIFPDNADLESCTEDFMKVNVSHQVADGVYVEFTASPSKCGNETQAQLQSLFSPYGYAHGMNVVYRCRGLVSLLHGVSHTIKCEAEEEMGAKHV